MLERAYSKLYGRALPLRNDPKSSSCPAAFEDKYQSMASYSLPPPGTQATTDSRGFTDPLRWRQRPSPSQGSSNTGQSDASHAEMLPSVTQLLRSPYQPQPTSTGHSRSAGQSPRSPPRPSMQAQDNSRYQVSRSWTHESGPPTLPPSFIRHPSESTTSRLGQRQFERAESAQRPHTSQPLSDEYERVSEADSTQSFHPPQLPHAETTSVVQFTPSETGTVPAHVSPIPQVELSPKSQSQERSQPPGWRNAKEARLTPTQALTQSREPPSKLQPRVVRDAVVPGGGEVWVYADGSTCPKKIGEEEVIPQWGVTKAGKPRKRLAMACMTCREKKIKCEPESPKCAQCEKSGKECRYEIA